MRKTNHIYYTCLVLWIFLLGSTGQLWAQSGFNPEPPPEPGFLAVKLTSNPDGCASFEQTNPQGYYASGAEVTVKVTPHRDYDFVAWTQDGEEVSTATEYTFTIRKTVRLVAKLQFNPKDNPIEPGQGYFNVMIESDPVDGGWVEQSHRGIHRTGETVQLTAHPSSSYEFHHWEIDGQTVGKEPTYQFTMPSKHVTVKTVYTWNPRSPIEPGTPGARMGEIIIVNRNPSGGYISQSGSGMYPYGAKATLKASPFEDYRFDGWYEGNTLLATTYTLKYLVNKEKSVVEARFSYVSSGDDDGGEEEDVDIEIGVGGEGNDDGEEKHGSVEVNGVLKPGREVELEAKPDDGFAFEGWYIDGEFVEDAEMDFNYLVEKGVTSIVAKFAELPFTLEMEGMEEGVQKAWAYVSRLRNNIATLKATKVEGYSFLGWFRGTTLLSKLMEYQYDVRNLRAALPAITAKYAEGSVANETIDVSDYMEASIVDGNLYFSAITSVEQLRLYRFDGSLIRQITCVEPASTYVIPVPKEPILIQVMTANHKAVTLKMR